MAYCHVVGRTLSSVPILLLFLSSSVHSQNNWGLNGPNINDPFKNGVTGFRDPFTNFKAPEPRLDLNNQKPDIVSRESPNSYNDNGAYPMSRQFDEPNRQFGGGNANQFGGGGSQFGGGNPQFNEPNPQFGGSASQFGGIGSQFGGGNSQFNEPNPQFGGSASQFGGAGPQFNMPQQQPQFNGIPDQSLPNLPNPSVQLPSFQEPNFNLPSQNMGGGNLMSGPGSFGGGGETGERAREFAGNSNGGWLQGAGGGSGGQLPFAQQPMGPVGAGQFNVPGLQSNPMQQIAMGSQQDFSSQPLDGQQVGMGGQQMGMGFQQPGFPQQGAPQLGVHQAGPQPFFPSSAPTNNFDQSNFQQQQQPQQGFDQGFQNQNGNQFQNNQQDTQNHNQNNEQQEQVQGNQNQNQNSQQSQNENQNAQQSDDQTQTQNENNQGGMVGSVKIVPIEPFHQVDVQHLATQEVQQFSNQDSNEDTTTQEAVIAEPLRIPEGLKVKPAGCGFHGLEQWQKSPCETCKCNKGVTVCEKVKCADKPDDSSCIPIFHFTTCCPTFQCAKNVGGVLPSIGKDVREGDSCKEEGEFVPTSTITPCSACECTDELKIKCKPISCPPRPKDPGCRERLPKNPTVCCAEFDCPRKQAVLNVTSVKPQSVTVDTNDDTDDSDAAGDASLPSTEEPMVVVLVAKTTTTTTTTTAEPATKRVLQQKKTTRRKVTTTTTEEPDYTDSDDAAAVTTPPRPQAAAVSEDADMPRIQLIRAQVTTTVTTTIEDVVPDETTAAATTTSSTTTKATTTARKTERTTAKLLVVPTAENPNSERGAIRDCQGGWKFPAGCDVNRDCMYVARWKQIPAEHSVRFKITTRDADKWTGIGFSKNKNFDKVDMVVGWVDKNAKVTIQDRHGDAHHPEMDHIQTLTNLHGSRSGNTTTIEFTRRQKSHDNEDIMIDDETCPHFIFPVKAGAYDSFAQNIQPHVEDPEVSDVGVCITKCTENAGAGSEVLTARTAFITTPSTTAKTTPATTTLADDSSDDDADSATSAPIKSAAAVSGATGGSCSVEGKVLSLNPCQNCTCQQGTIQCLNINCGDSFSQHIGCVPSFKVGVCCPEWECPKQSARITAAPSITGAPVAFGSGRIDQRTTVPITQQTSATLVRTSTAKPIIALAKNPDKLLLLSKKQFNGTNSEDETNSELDQIPDRMGVVTPPPGWTMATGAVDDESATVTAVAPVVLLPVVAVDPCLNFACGANASCVVIGTGTPSCICKNGFDGDAIIACLRPNGKAATNLCTAVHCGLNARCYDMDGAPQCKCDSGFRGDPAISCDIEIHGGFVQPAECQLRSEIGGCQNFGMRWQFDSRISGCRQFVYSGCAGNDNNFVSRVQCEQRCMPQKRFYRDRVCDSDTDLDSPACARCECAEQGFLACTPISCGAPPNKDCHAIPQAGECCPKYDCTILSNANSSDATGGTVNTRSDVCSGVTCHEQALKPGCIRSKLPGDCCATVQCGTVAVNASVLNFTQTASQNVSLQLPGVPCSLDDKISSSNPCLSCQCVNGSTTCSQVTCPPITPEQRRRCRITQQINQCCLNVECSAATRAPLPARTTPVMASTEVVASNDDESADSTTHSSSILPSLSIISAAIANPATTVAPTTTAVWTRPSRRGASTAGTTVKNAVLSTDTTAAPVIKVAVVTGKLGCSEASDGGVCRATITRWYYNAATGNCEKFIYSGCGGNKNRYLTEERCKSSCK